MNVWVLVETNKEPIAPYIQLLLLLDCVRHLLLIAGKLLSINYELKKRPGVLFDLMAFVHIFTPVESLIYTVLNVAPIIFTDTGKPGFNHSVLTGGSCF